MFFCTPGSDGLPDIVSSLKTPYPGSEKLKIFIVTHFQFAIAKPPSPTEFTLVCVVLYTDAGQPVQVIPLVPQTPMLFQALYNAMMA